MYVLICFKLLSVLMLFHIMLLMCGWSGFGRRRGRQVNAQREALNKEIRRAEHDDEKLRQDRAGEIKDLRDQVELLEDRIECVEERMKQKDPACWHSKSGSVSFENLLNGTLLKSLEPGQSPMDLARFDMQFD